MLLEEEHSEEEDDEWPYEDHEWPYEDHEWDHSDHDWPYEDHESDHEDHEWDHEDHEWEWWHHEDHDWDQHHEDDEEQPQDDFVFTPDAPLFSIHHFSMTYDDASEYCNNIGGSLASIHNKDEQAELMSILRGNH